MLVGGPVSGDRREPGAEGPGIAQPSELVERGQEHLLYEVVDLGSGEAGEEDGVDHPAVAVVELLEGAPVSRLRGPDEERVEVVGHRPTLPDRVGHVNRIHRETRLPAVSPLPGDKTRRRGEVLTGYLKREGSIPYLRTA
jgi:hypothetical protein